MRSRVIICEASEIITTGLTTCLEEQDQYSVVARLNAPDRLSEKILSSDADILIINPALLGYTDRDLPVQLAKEHPRLVIVALVTSYHECGSLKPYDGVIEINDTSQKYISKLNEIVNQKKHDEKSDDSFELSRREIDVLIAVAKGMTNKEISDQLNISIHTVISHRKNITKKTGIKSVSGLTVYALLNNLIDENEVYK